MSQSDARRARRFCARNGHLGKTDGTGHRLCARCGQNLDDEDGGAGVREPRRPKRPPGGLLVKSQLVHSGK